jgi:hypothetical protein
MLSLTFGFAPGNFGPNPDQMSPGVAVIVSQIMIQRAPPEAPDSLSVNAAEINPAPKIDQQAPRRRGKEAQNAKRP